LKLMLLINKINVHFAVRVPLKEFFNKNNIQNLADYLITINELKSEPANNFNNIEIRV